MEVEEIQLNAKINTGPKKVIIHWVKESDTLPGISLLYGIQLSDLKRINKIYTDVDKIHLKFLIVPLEFCRFTDKYLSLLQPTPENTSTITTSATSVSQNLIHIDTDSEQLNNSNPEQQVLIVTVSDYNYQTVSAEISTIKHVPVTQTTQEYLKEVDANINNAKILLQSQRIEMGIDVSVDEDLDESLASGSSSGWFLGFGGKPTRRQNDGSSQRLLSDGENENENGNRSLLHAMLSCCGLS